MSLSPGTQRVGVTYDPNTLYITPDIKLQKSSAATEQDELARLGDVIALNQYNGVIFVGNVLPEYYYFVSVNDRLGGAINAPFNFLSDAYLAALSRFGAPSPTNKVLVLLVGAAVTETASVVLSSPYIDIMAIGNSEVMITTSAAPLFTISADVGGSLIDGLSLVSNNAPVFKTLTTDTLVTDLTFSNCKFSDIGVGTSLVELGHTTAGKIVLDKCLFTSNNQKTIRSTAGSLANQFKITNSAFNVIAGTAALLSGDTYLEGELYNCVLDGAVGSIILSSSVTDLVLTIIGLTIKSSISTSLCANTLNCTVQSDNVESSGALVLNVAANGSATLEGYLRNVVAPSLTLNNTLLAWEGFLLVNVVAATSIIAASISPTVEFINCQFTGVLVSNVDTTSVITCAGVASPKIKNCNTSVRLFNHTGSGVFAGQVIGGLSRGISRVATMATPIRQCIIRNHVMLKQNFPVNGNTITSTYYPDLLIADSSLPGGQSDYATPVLISGLQSEGLIDSEVANFTTLTNRFVILADSSFASRTGKLNPVFPLVTGNAEAQISIAGVSVAPLENISSRTVNDRAIQYVQRIAARWGDLVLGQGSQTLWFDSASFAFTSVWAFRDAINLERYSDTIHVRLSSGESYIDVINPLFSPWTALAINPDAGADWASFNLLNVAFPFSYQFMGSNTIRITVNGSPAINNLDLLVKVANLDECVTTPSAHSLPAPNS